LSNTAPGSRCEPQSFNRSRVRPAFSADLSLFVSYYL